MNGITRLPGDVHLRPGPCPVCVAGNHVYDRHECLCCDALECLDEGMEGDCDGPVEYRMALSGTGISYPRCEKHWDARLIRQDEINARYPQHQPSDFDPSYAGEVWYEEDY